MASASDATQATIYRDEFGIPHVFAPTIKAAAYAVGYAQAEDRLEELLKNLVQLNPEQAVVIRGDEAGAYKNIVGVLNICTDAGITNVAFATAK